jgi:malate/lactate dehydrogenase
MKASPLIDELALYDVVNTPGVGVDLSHISTPAVCILQSELLYQELNRRRK